MGSTTVPRRTGTFVRNETPARSAAAAATACNPPTSTHNGASS
nr:hypothetical protein [Micromonospora sp. DSM 115978]